MVGENLEIINREWREKRGYSINILILGFGIFVGAMSSMNKLELPNELTGNSIVFYLSIVLMGIGISSLISFYVMKEKKRKAILRNP